MVPCSKFASCGPPMRTTVSDPWIRPRMASSVRAWEMALRKVLSTKFAAPPRTSAISAIHNCAAKPSTTTVMPHAAAAAAMRAPWRRARVKVPDRRPTANTPAG